MRIFPILTAILVTAGLFLVVFERDALLSFAGRDAAEEQIPAEDDTAAVTATPEEEPARIVSVIAMNSTAKLVDSAVVLRGRTEAARQVNVAAETSGRVVSDPLRKGALVSQGQLLCTIDPGTRADALAEAQARLAEANARLPEARARIPEAEAALLTARARLEEAKARLEEAEINEKAASSLSEDGFASETRVKAARAALESARAGVTGANSGVVSAQTGIETARSGLASVQAAIQSAEAAVAAAKREIERLDIHAPFAGLLESDTAELGSLLQPGALCATVIQLDPIKLAGFVPETSVARVEHGAMAGARLASGQEVVGKVTFVSRSADEQTRTFRVEIAVPNPDLVISDGQTADILIQAEGENAHLIPQSALTLDDAGVLGVRTVDSDSKAQFHAVEIIRDTPTGVWVRGLPQEAAIITVGQEFVIDGVTVKPVFEEPAL
ncbi:MAG: efflux RND transporter periplasmic adaptor subunit [Brevirhabdus sp.]